jgi:hypothetical protein
MNAELNIDLLNTCLIQAKAHSQAELCLVESNPRKKLSSYGKALQTIIGEANADLIPEYELIINKRSQRSSNERNAILAIFNTAITNYNLKIQENENKKNNNQKDNGKKTKVKSNAGTVGSTQKSPRSKSKNGTKASSPQNNG